MTKGLILGIVGIVVLGGLAAYYISTKAATPAVNTPATLTSASTTYTANGSNNYLTGTTLYNSTGGVIATNVASYNPQYLLVTLLNGSTITLNPTQK